MQAMHQMTMMRAPDSLFSKGLVPNGHWAECAAEMQLTPEQIQHLFTIREAFCKRAAALRDQRRALIRASTQVQLHDCSGHGIFHDELFKLLQHGWPALSWINT